MLSNKPYLLRAFFQWIVDSACTPILVLDANHPRCKIPTEYVESGEIVFNISSTAVRDLKITNELIEFKASFSGVIHFISAPLKAVLAIYAEENGEGIFFDLEDEGSIETSSTADGDNSIFKLRTVESGPIDSTEQQLLDITPQPLIKSKPVLKLVDT